MYSLDDLTLHKNVREPREDGAESSRLERQEDPVLW